MHPYDRAIIEYEGRMWDEILRAELSLWARFKALFRKKLQIVK